MPIRQNYAARVRDGHIEPDAAQQRVVELLDVLCEELEGYSPARKTAALGWLFGTKAGGEAPKGLYLWGGVGRGKSMLMDMFFERATVAKKRRVHFHAFMAEVHAAIFKYRQALKKGTVKGEDPIGPVAEDVAAHATLLCFDEFIVTDIADAMILGRLFKVLFSRGVVVVATSNVEPRDLYRDGLNRSLFLPSIELIETHMDIVELDSRADYRMRRLAGTETYHVPADAAAATALTAAFKALTGRENGNPTTLEVLGRKIAVPQSRGNVARFSFDALCEKPLGAQDYLAIARRYHAVIIDDIPALSAAQRNPAQRFVILIDTFYEARIKLFASAAAEPATLFETADRRGAAAYERTISRLNEMRSAEYMALPRGQAMRGDMAGIVDT